MASIQMRKMIKMHLCLDSLLLNGKTIDTRRSNDAAIIVNVFTLMEIVDRNGSNWHLLIKKFSNYKKHF